MAVLSITRAAGSIPGAAVCISAAAVSISGSWANFFSQRSVLTDFFHFIMF